VSKVIVLVVLGASTGATARRRQDDESKDLQRIAVLPFQDDGSTKTPGLGDGIADGITTRLSELGGVAIVGQNVLRNQSLHGGAADSLLKQEGAVSVAKKLSVDTLITGTFKKVGSKLEVHCTIMDVQSGKVQDGNTIDVTESFPKGYAAILESLPESVVQKLRPSAASTSRPKVAGAAKSFEVNQLYCAGLEQANLGTPEGLMGAKASFEKAVIKDPAFAEAFAAKADAEAQLSRLEAKKGQDSLAANDRDLAWSDALSAVKKAPYYGGAHWQMSRALTLLGDYEDAAVAARVATALWPANSEVYLDLSRAIGQGTVVQGPEIQRAIRMSPAIALVAPEMARITIVNGGPDTFNVTFTQAKERTFTSLEVPAGASRVVGLVSGRYDVKATGGSATLLETRDFRPGDVLSLDGRTLVADVGGPKIGEIGPQQKDKDIPQPKTTIVRNMKTNSNMVYVFQGEFPMGDDNQPHNKYHRVNLSAYWIGQTPVTIGQFRDFTKASDGYETTFGHKFDWDKKKPSYGWNGDDYPMVNVDWHEAQAYCMWAGGDLPTEAQWEHAARGPRNFLYPWGNEWDPTRLQWSLGKPGSAHGTAKVTAHDAGKSLYGCFDMAGNVAQWCLDGFQTDPPSQYMNPLGSGKTKAVRGGSWDLNSPLVFVSTYRMPPDPRKPTKYSDTYRDETLGFRFVCPDVHQGKTLN
jgi:formylglycine-generating enzyme required for sulfatase activity/TolB-like protein